MPRYHAKIDPGLLIPFLTVADCGAVATAARLLARSQPAVTAQIRKLERELGATLFLRASTGMTLTAAGRRFYADAQKVYGMLTAAVAAVAPEQEVAGTLELAASTTIASHVLPPLLTEFQKRYPQVHLKLVVANTQDVLALVSAGKMPIGLVEGLPHAAPLHLEPFVEDELVLVGAPRFASRLRSVADLKGVPIIWREQGSGTRSVVEKALRDAGAKRKDLEHRTEFGSTEAIKTAVVCGMGVGFLSRWSLQSELALGRLVVVRLEGLIIRRMFHWALPAGGASGVAAAFCRFAKAETPATAIFPS